MIEANLPDGWLATERELASLEEKIITATLNCRDAEELRRIIAFIERAEARETVG